MVHHSTRTLKVYSIALVYVKIKKVEEIETALNQLRALATSVGGYLLQENTTAQGAKPSGVMVIQVPAEQSEVSITRIWQLAFKVDRTGNRRHARPGQRGLAARKNP